MFVPSDVLLLCWLKRHQKGTVTKAKGRLSKQVQAFREKNVRGKVIFLLFSLTGLRKSFRLHIKLTPE